ncbi:MAG: DeoR/GlpR family DNA-binding transcription regulator [Selenomonadaceae bacterium]|jgi:Transcriptional regulators of sugar metabolism
MKINRIHKIQEILEDNQSVSINRLCDIFNVSKNTIRRDIAELEKRDLIKKVYGGIMLKPTTTAPEPFASREIKNSPQKKQIARLAAELVSDGEVIYIDSGTTTMHMIPYLAEKNNITIVTASLNVINAATAYNQFNVISTGGTLYLPSKAFVGTSVLNCLKNYNISKAFLASTGISLEKGVTNAAPLEYEIKQYLVQKCSIKILLADSSKIDKASLMTYCQLKDISCLIIDKEPPANYLAYLKENNIRLLTTSLHEPS